ncbi:ABC transporter permease [Patescibacteria group bacterium]|nr:ABC transporter permease [Patescibacteria group bacterium]MBU4476940.1 ABC transporter permease [Patescibacteria group bacterium]MCG2699040.1 ABC transporter permease [Candidatus Parcubacteria bacterium]
MKFKNIFKTSFEGLRVNKSRSALTVLGIVIGITSIILIAALGQGAQNLILGQIQGQVGSKVIEIAPGRQPKGPTDIMSIFSDSLKQKDVDALAQKSNAPHITTIMPLVFGSESVAFGSETYQATIYGMTDAAEKLYNVSSGQGRFLTEDDVKSYADVVVIGSGVKEELFENYNEAVGQKIKIKGRNFKVIGVLDTKGQGMLIGFDEVVIMPYTTAQRYILGIKHFQHLIVEADTEENIIRTVEDIEITLRNSHNITDPEKDDFNVTSQADAMEMVSTITDILTMFLVAVAAISLIVGGIGIMNIMLVSVTERTREIGLRKAIGATDSDILFQFLFEAIALTVTGGIIGIALGAIFSLAAAIILTSVLAMDWSFAFPVSAAIIGFCVAAFVGLVFGIYPARKASRKHPIEALRYE